MLTGGVQIIAFPQVSRAWFLLCAGAKKKKRLNDRGGLKPGQVEKLGLGNVLICMFDSGVIHRCKEISCWRRIPS